MAEDPGNGAQDGEAVFPDSNVGSGPQGPTDLPYISGPEHAEALKHTRFEIVVDQQKLSDAQELNEEMKAWLVRLPERLSFRDPITLIVGDNGMGKTSFARAVVSTLGAARDPNGRSKIFPLRGEEPAIAIASAIHSAEAPNRNLISHFIEGSALMHNSREWAKDQASEGDHGLGGSPDEHRLSSRELFDQALITEKRQGIDSHRERVFEQVGGDVVVVFDEPEAGLSPQRQMDLPKTLAEFLPPSDTLIVPTNNLVLFLSDLPRLDLSQPERGVHKPSEYGEQGRIEFHLHPETPTQIG